MKVKQRVLYFLVSLCLISLCLPSVGCALLGLDSDRPEDSDPVAAAALRLRRGGDADRGPASLRAAEPEAVERVRGAMQEGEVIPGMRMSDVKAILGEPKDIEVAGDRGDGNERWIYGTSSGRYGLHNALRTIYFEQGRVAGWETPQ